MATVTYSTRQQLTREVRYIRWLTETTFAVGLEDDGLRFEPGQYVNVGMVDDIEMREYSIYTAPEDDVLEILVRRVDQGLVSRKLGALCAGAKLRVEGPFGFFTIPQEERESSHLFVSTGTGIAPFRSFVRAYPELDYTIIQGVRYRRELYDWDEYRADRRVACVSREAGGDFRGRTTDYLRHHAQHHRIGPDTRCYLCGNCDMIYESYDILRGFGVASDAIHAEVYF